MSEDKQYDFYVAGPFFDPEQTASMERLKRYWKTHGKVLFCRGLSARSKK